MAVRKWEMLAASKVKMSKYVTRGFLEVSRCSRSKQRQRNVQKRVPCKVDFLFRNCIADIMENCSVSPRVFLIEKWKIYQKLNWSGIVLCTSLTMKKIVECRRQNNSGRGKTEWDLSLSCTFYQGYFVSSSFKPAALLKYSFIFNCPFRTNKS